MKEKLEKLFEYNQQKLNAFIYLDNVLKSNSREETIRNACKERDCAFDLFENHLTLLVESGIQFNKAYIAGNNVFVFKNIKGFNKPCYIVEIIENANC
jgi:hypothetical protein